MQFNTVTEDHEQMRPALEAMKLTAKICGQDPVQLVTTDNPAHNKLFMQSMFEILLRNEEQFNKFLTESDSMKLPPKCTVGDANIT